MTDFNEKRPCRNCGAMVRSRRSDNNHFCHNGCRMEFKRTAERRTVEVVLNDPAATLDDYREAVRVLLKKIERLESKL